MKPARLRRSTLLSGADRTTGGWFSAQKLPLERGRSRAEWYGGTLFRRLGQPWERRESVPLKLAAWEFPSPFGASASLASWFKAKLGL